jgi:hypothetical protein
MVGRRGFSYCMAIKRVFVEEFSMDDHGLFGRMDKNRSWNHGVLTYAFDKEKLFDGMDENRRHPWKSIEETSKTNMRGIV